MVRARARVGGAFLDRAFTSLTSRGGGGGDGGVPVGFQTSAPPFSRAAAGWKVVVLGWLGRSGTSSPSPPPPPGGGGGGGGRGERERERVSVCERERGLFHIWLEVCVRAAG